MVLGELGEKSWGELREKRSSGKTKRKMMSPLTGCMAPNVAAKKLKQLKLDFFSSSIKSTKCSKSSKSHNFSKYSTSKKIQFKIDDDFNVIDLDEGPESSPRGMGKIDEDVVESLDSDLFSKMEWRDLGLPLKRQNICPYFICSSGKSFPERKQKTFVSTKKIVSHLLTETLEMGSCIECAILAFWILQRFFDSFDETVGLFCFKEELVTIRGREGKKTLKTYREYDFYELVNASLWISTKFLREYDQYDGIRDEYNWADRDYFCNTPIGYPYECDSHAISFLEVNILKRIGYSLTRKSHFHFALRYFFMICTFYRVNGEQLYLKYVICGENPGLAGDHPLLILLEAIIALSMYIMMFEYPVDLRKKDEETTQKNFPKNGGVGSCEKRNKNADKIGNMIVLYCVRQMVRHSRDSTHPLSPFAETAIIHEKYLAFVENTILHAGESPKTIKEFISVVAFACNYNHDDRFGVAQEHNRIVFKTIFSK